MNWLNTILVLITAYLVVFFQSSVTGFRDLVGAQPDLLPGLIVFVSLTASLPELMLIAIVAGLWTDALSANPLGVSILPLFLVGFVLGRYRGLVNRNQLNTQWMLGTAAHAAVPVMTVFLLWFLNQSPLIGWFSLWQWFVITLMGTAATPVWFRLFDRLTGALNYQAVESSSFRPDRQIKRGRH